MAIDTASVQAFTDAELLALYRAAAAAIATGQSYNVNGRSLTRADAAEVWNIIDRLDARIAAASGSDCALAKLGDRI